MMASAIGPPQVRRSYRWRLALPRVSYRLCAIFELLAVVPMLVPDLFGKVMAIPSFRPGSDFRYAMGIAAVFTLGWILLLVWADRKPVERKGVMLLTVAVFAGNLLCGVYAAASGLVQPAMMIPSWIVQIAIMILFTVSFVLAGHPGEPQPAGERPSTQSKHVAAVGAIEQGGTGDILEIADEAAETTVEVGAE